MILSASQLLFGVLTLAHSGLCRTNWDRDLLKEIYTVAGHIQTLGIDLDFRGVPVNAKSPLRSYSSAIRLPETFKGERLQHAELLELCAIAWFQAAVIDDHANEATTVRKPPTVMTCLHWDDIVVFGTSVMGNQPQFQKAMRVEPGNEQGKGVTGTVTEKLYEYFGRPGLDDKTTTHKYGERCGEVNALRAREDIFGLEVIKPHTILGVAFGSDSEYPIDFPAQINPVWSKLDENFHKSKTGENHPNHNKAWTLGLKEPCASDYDETDLAAQKGCRQFMDELGVEVIDGPTLGRELTFKHLYDKNKNGIAYKLISTNRQPTQRPLLEAPKQKGDPVKAPPLKQMDDIYALPCDLESVYKQLNMNPPKAKGVATGKGTGKGKARRDLEGIDFSDSLNTTDVFASSGSRKASDLPNGSTSSVARSGSLVWKAEILRRDLAARSSACISIKSTESKDAANCKRTAGGACQPKTKGAKGAKGKDGKSAKGAHEQPEHAANCKRSAHGSCPIKPKGGKGVQSKPEGATAKSGHPAEHKAKAAHE